MTPKTKKRSRENKAVKFLERSSVIRIFGLALVLAPFFNAALVIWMKKINHHNVLTPAILFKLFTAGTFAQQSLTLASITIGFIMLLGSKKAWHFVLVLLGCHILIQVTSIGRDLRENWLWGPFFLVNISIFYFIADQLVFKLKVPVQAPTKATPPEQPARAAAEQKVLKTRKKIMIHFDQKGPWAQLIGITDKGLQVRSQSPLSLSLHSRDLEVGFSNGLTLRTRLQRRHENDYYFEFTSMTQDHRKLLNKWIKNLAA